MSIDDAARLVGRRLASVLGGADDEPEPPTHGARQGDRLGPYVVLRELGAGGMGTVFLAERADGGFDRKVAIKLLRGFPTADAQSRLRRERRILAELDHPAIARLLDGGETEDGQPYLVIEYVEGRPLLEAAAERDRAGRLALWRTIAEAVAHAHQRLVIHRDLKPNNVLVRADGAPKLLDFGIAKLVDAGADTDAVSTRLFTPGYASPEQRAGGAITTRTDVHALGGLLHELLRAQRPDGAPSLPALWPVPIDRDLAAIIARARAEDPAARYATVDALLEDLDAWTEGRAVRARGDNALYAARKLLWRLRVPVALLAAAAAATAAFVVELRDARDRAVEAEQQARAEQARAERSARRATSLLTFVTQTFEAASPENTLGRSLSARELIVAAERRLAEADAADRGPLALFLAELYAELGERTEAIRLAATATAAAEPPKDTEAGRWLVDAYARAAAHLGPVDAERAIAAAERARTLQATYAPRELEAAVTASVVLGMARHHAFEHDAARAALEAVWTSTLTPAAFERQTRREVANILAGIARQQGDAAAQARAAERLRVWLADLPPTHPQQARWLNQRAGAEALAGDYDAAITDYQRAIEIASTATAGGARIAALWNDLGVTAMDAGRFVLAAHAMERAVALSAPSNAPADHAIDLLNLSSAEENVGDYARAEATLRSALALEGGAWPGENRRRAQSNLARLLGLRGRFAEARALFDTTLRTAPPEGVVFERLRRGQLELLAGDGAAADVWLERAEAGLAEHPAAIQVRRALRRTRARVRLLRGDAAAAAAQATALLPEFITTYGERAFDTDLLRVDLAEAQHALGQLDAARATLAPVIPRLAVAVVPEEVNRRRAERVWRALEARR